MWQKQNNGTSNFPSFSKILFGTLASIIWLHYMIVGQDLLTYQWNVTEAVFIFTLPLLSNVSYGEILPLPEHAGLLQQRL